MNLDLVDNIMFKRNLYAMPSQKLLLVFQTFHRVFSKILFFCCKQINCRSHNL